MSQTFKHRDIQEGDTVARKSHMRTHPLIAERAKVKQIGFSDDWRRRAFLQWPSSKRGAWVLCENLVKVAE